MSDPSDPVESKQPSIQVIARAAAILRALGSNSGGLSLSAIANIVKLPRSTVHRIIVALEEEHLVESIGPSGGFRLGHAFGQLIHQTQADIISSVREFLNSLSAQVRESVCLATLAGAKVNVVDCIIVERELRVVFSVGIEAPAYATAAGKIMLAAFSDDALQAILPKKLQELTEHTLTRAQLITQLQEVRQSAVAVDDQEHIEGVCTFAVALETYLGNYSISIIAPSIRAGRNGDTYKAALMDCKYEIEKKIGRMSKGAVASR
ncbi:IclR family transcriptional regulator [Pseudomonas syringae pv. syringae]|uniref:IclR family transcriptional regulator n=1 Tax=Pseudomonas syringae TaxID=317 RepID=UPI0023F6C92F|nr:IclR family transcriptional regulator [Pseudomonas syringae]MDF5890222.1 IclR family transcriptional regulator [Pseudomonas syringae pv. syringae]